MATLSTGADAEPGDRFADCEYNDIKNHWRSTAAAIITDPQPGMIFSESDDEQLFHRWAASWRLVLQEWDNTFIINPAGGGHYKTIQAALTAENAGGETFLVPPGTYTDTIHFSASNQSVISLGDFNNTEVTQADANIVDAGAHTGCEVRGIKINLSAPTTAIYAVQASTGSVDIVDCHGHLATAVALVAANQPALVNISGAGQVQVIRGMAEYFHTGNTGGGGVKCAFKVSANGAFLHLHNLIKGTITNSGTALSTCIYVDFGTAIVEMHLCREITVTDPNCTLLVGLGYTGAAGAHNIMGNHIDVVATNNAGWGLYHTGTGTIRMSHNVIHVTDVAGTSNSYYIAATATLETHMDEWRADDGSTIVAGGTLHIVSSEDEGELTISSSLDMLDDARITGGNDDSILISYDENRNDAVIWGLPVAAKRGLIFCDVADIAVDFTGLITAHPQPVAWWIDLDNNSYLGVGHQADDRPGIWSNGDVHIQYDANGDVVLFGDAGGGENPYVYIYGDDTGTPKYLRMRVEADGDALVEAEDDLNLDAATVHLIKGQLAFPAIAVPSAGVNTLDDYEEGAWAPDLQFGGAKVGITYGVQAGLYTKIGRVVTVTGVFLLSNKGVSVGNAEIYGLPFSVLNVAGAVPIPSLFFISTSFADVFQCFVEINTAYIRLYEITNAGVITSLDNTNFSNISDLRFNFSYFTD